MKDKILDIVSQHCEGWKNCEELTEKLFDLYNVSQHKEVIAANFEKLADVKLKTSLGFQGKMGLNQAPTECNCDPIGDYTIIKTKSEILIYKCHTCGGCI